MITKRRPATNYDDQTSFASGSVLYEPISRPTTDQDKTAAKNKKIKPVLLGVGILLLLIGLVVAYGLYQENGSGVAPIKEPELTEEQQRELTPFRRRLSELEADLEQADPNQEKLPFPPVDLELNLVE